MNKHYQCLLQSMGPVSELEVGRNYLICWATDDESKMVWSVAEWKGRQDGFKNLDGSRQFGSVGSLIGTFELPETSDEYMDGWKFF